MSLVWFGLIEGREMKMVFILFHFIMFIDKAQIKYIIEISRRHVIVSVLYR